MALLALDQFFVDAIVTSGLWLRSALVAVGLLFIMRQYPRFAVRPLETAFVASLIAMTQLAAFPPMRIQGDWRVRDTGLPAGILKSRELDQLAFGACPHYVWPGTSWEYVGIAQFKLHFINDAYAASAFDRRLDFVDLSVEIVLLGVIMFFIRSHARKRKLSLVLTGNRTQKVPSPWELP
jgi:hypothetical protein